MSNLEQAKSDLLKSILERIENLKMRRQQTLNLISEWPAAFPEVRDMFYGWVENFEADMLTMNQLIDFLEKKI
jgi:secreted Zn-dependent insulinase-like peptidase